MKLLKILVGPISIKGDPTDRETIQADLFEQIQHMFSEGDTDWWEIEDEESEDDEESYQ